MLKSLRFADSFKKGNQPMKKLLSLALLLVVLALPVLADDGHIDTPVAPPPPATQDGHIDTPLTTALFISLLIL
jgi:hypothetical protein